MAFPTVTYTFVDGTDAVAAEVNQNFSDIINGISDGTKALNIATLSTTGNVAIGNSSSNSLLITASLSGSIAVDTNVVYYLGGATLGFAGIYLGGTGSFTVLVKAPSSLGATYTLTLPASLPAQQRNVVMSSAGVLSTGCIKDTGTDAIVAGTLEVTSTFQADGDSHLGAGGCVVNSTDSKTLTTGSNVYAFVTSPVPSAHALFMVRGRFHVSGSTAVKDSGEGFTVSRTGSDNYSIIFSPVFGDTPTVTYGFDGSQLGTIGGDVASAAGVTVICTGSESGRFISFIAVGQRA